MAAAVVNAGNCIVKVPEVAVLSPPKSKIATAALVTAEEVL
jgi:hypothetical protein